MTTRRCDPNRMSDRMDPDCKSQIFPDTKDIGIEIERKCDPTKTTQIVRVNCTLTEKKIPS